MSDEQVTSFYLPVVQEIAIRLGVAEDAWRQVTENPENPLNFAGCEVAVMQIRKVCELFLLGAVASHLKDAGAEISDTKWRPKDAFFELEKVNEHPLPFWIDIQLNKSGPGQHHIEPLSQSVPYAALSKVYGVCGDLLHVPSARQVFEQRLPEFDVPLLSRWLDGLKELTKAHALMLPARKIIMLCVWTGDPKITPTVYKLEAAGESTMDMKSYPAFGLFP